MELALSLGDAPKTISVADQSRSQQQKVKELGFCMNVGSSSASIKIPDHDQYKNLSEKNDDDKTNCSSSSSDQPPLQLDLLPFSPALNQSPPPPPSGGRPFPWLSQICKSHFLPTFLCSILSTLNYLQTFHDFLI